MKKILTVILSLCLAISLCGCSSNNTPISINVENPSDLNGITAGRKALIEIEVIYGTTPQHGLFIGGTDI